jgi:Xaa-Pro aminopeptidase
MLYEMGSDDVEAINAISGERCNPHPHNFTDRYFRPGDQAFFDILQSYQGYRTCYYRTFNIGRATPSQNDAYVKAREWIDASIAMIKPGVSTDKVAEVWPKAEEFGFPSEEAAFGLQFGHGLGLALHERPIISRAISLDHPMEIQTGMVFALETYCPASRRLLCSAHRGRGRRDRDGLRGHLAVPGRGTADRQPLLSSSLEGPVRTVCGRARAGDREP